MLKPQILVGELLFRTRGKGVAVVCVHRGESTFTLSRVIKSGSVDELTKADPYNGEISGYILEATQNWGDLEREGVVWKPQGRGQQFEAGEATATF